MEVFNSVKQPINFICCGRIAMAFLGSSARILYLNQVVSSEMKGGDLVES